jgi:DEAD/DEAH box helicase/Helicase conserved C-terminal domain
MLSQVLDIALGVLESLEMRSLTWGFVDQSLSEDEAEAAIEAALRDAGHQDSAADVLDALRDAHLVRVVRESNEMRYRTRVAELIRLLSRLRQWFANQTWQASPTLVSDFRIAARPRRYPARNITAVDALARVGAGRPLSALQQRVWSALTGGDAPMALSEFQVQAAQRILGCDAGQGTIVTSGTGSGKTLSFYLPALVAITPEIRKNEFWTKILCIYPRQELLKDQLSEAYKLTQRARAMLAEEGRRPFVLGGLFLATPYEATERAVDNARWRKVPDGYVCPYLKCPVCDAEMLWRAEDLRSREESLVCTNTQCHTRVDNTTLRLTRRAVDRSPPDLLFTTTETLNRRLCDTGQRRVFGVGNESIRQPLFALLDEVHTYAGVPGAQVALLLRRWSALLGRRRIRWVGLSATLPSATKFFSELTGAREDLVQCIAPKDADMVAEGSEYTIILRSDPSSQTAVLSTSIQTIMLLSRMLDPRNNNISRGRFGSRTFVFTDDLDVTHRLYDDFLNAEGYDRWRREQAGRLPLAALRGSTQEDLHERELYGQRWLMAEDLRGPGGLATRMAVSRTTSRDPGVDASTDVIVATSSLEVGFNDLNVGAIVQHKAPRSAASFLQRKGRAGRVRTMRPLTVIVLSGYGRDRVAFDSYERLFEPSVEIEPLPIRNLYVLRMQAVLATFDWIADRAPRDAKGWLWQVLNKPTTDTRLEKLLTHAKQVLKNLLQFDPATLDSLRRHLQKALAIDADTLESVLWQPPRSLLLEALPTLGRRLFRNWELAGGEGLDIHKEGSPHPLPDFIPASLFAELNLPEVLITVPTRGGQPQLESMLIVQALQQLAPGRVIRRFADAQGGLSHWFPLDLVESTQTVKVSRYAPRHEYVRQIADLPVVRPWQIALSIAPPGVKETSNAEWSWRSEFQPLGNATSVELPNKSGLRIGATTLEFRLHRFGGALSVCRFAHEGRANLRVDRQRRLINFHLVDDHDNPTAVGFAFEADALLMPFSPPTAAAFESLVLAPGLTRWLRYLAFAQHVEDDPDLPQELDRFRREWLHQAVLGAALDRARLAGLTLQQALLALRDDPDEQALIRAIQALANGRLPAWNGTGESYDEAGPGDANGNEPPRPERLVDNLTQAIAEPGVRERLIDLALRWATPVATDWAQWLVTVTCATVGEAVYQACVTAAPRNAAAEGLTIDVDATPTGHRAIVAETTLGGGGTIEALAGVFAADPRSFVRAIESACAPADQEIAAEDLRRVMARLTEDRELATALGNLRAAPDTATRDQAREVFFHLLVERGIYISRTLSVLIGTRLIRPGTSPESDALTHDLLREWQSVEERYGIALPVRLATAVVAANPSLRTRLASLGGTGKEILTAGILLWPAGGELRQRALQSYNPFRRSPVVDAALAHHLLFETRLRLVSDDGPNWLSQLRDELALHGTVRLATSRGNDSWRTQVLHLLSEPIVSGYLHFYPMIEATRVLEDGRLAIDFVLRDRV